MCEQRKLSRKKIREAEVEVAVDTGAVMVLSPRELEEQLGLSRLGRVIVRLANEERIELERPGLPVNHWRSAYVRNLPDRSNWVRGARGQIVLEELNLIPHSIAGAPSRSPPFYPR